MAKPGFNYPQLLKLPKDVSVHHTVHDMNPIRLFRDQNPIGFMYDYLHTKTLGFMTVEYVYTCVYKGFVSSCLESLFPHGSKYLYSTYIGPKVRKDIGTTFMPRYIPYS